MFKVTAALVLALSVVFAPTAAVSPSSHSVKTTKAGQVVFTAKTKAKLNTAANKKLINNRAKKYHSTKKFERDIRGCEIQYKTYTVNQSTCLNLTIKFHGMYS